MKKILIIVAIAVFSLFSFSACVYAETDVLAESVSYAETRLLYGDAENYSVEIRVGFYEDIRANDGKVGELKPFVNIAVIPLSAGAEPESITYSYVGTEGTLERSAVRYAYSAKLATDQVSSEIKLVINGEETLVELTDVTSGYIDYKEAIAIASSEFREIIEKETAEGVFMRETQVRIMRDTVGGKPFYYYVAAVKQGEDFPSAAVLIDPASKKAVAKRT